MSKVCAICGKGPSMGIRKSHSNVKTKRKVYLNLQSKKINGRRRKICTSCLRSLNK